MLDKPGTVVYLVTYAEANATSAGGVTTASSILNQDPSSLFTPVPLSWGDVTVIRAGVQYFVTIPFLPDKR